MFFGQIRRSYKVALCLLIISGAIFSGIHWSKAPEVSAEASAPSVPVSATDFVNHLYSCVLNRTASSGEQSAWLDAFTIRNASVTEMYEGFFLSTEFANRQLDNTAYVTMLYRCVLFRNPGSSDIAAWVGVIENGQATRNEVLNPGFFNSQEFQNIAQRLAALKTVIAVLAAPTFSPKAGDYTTSVTVKIEGPSGAAVYYTTDGSQPTTTSRLYTSPLALTQNTTIKAKAVKSGYADSPVVSAAYTISRAPVDKEDIDKVLPVVNFTPLSSTTVSGIVTLSFTATDNVGVTKATLKVNGLEVKTFTTSPYSYVLDTAILSNGQHLFTAEAYDAAGNKGQAQVTLNISNKKQEQERPQPQPKPVPQPQPKPPAQAYPVTSEGFIGFLYTCFLDREAEAEGLTAWLNHFNNGLSLPELYHGFYNSPEFNSRKLSDTEFVTKLYKCILFRNPDANGQGAWIKVLAQGRSRTFVAQNFTDSPEFKRAVEPYLERLRNGEDIK
jgi:hypothetical protein